MSSISCAVIWCVDFKANRIRLDALLVSAAAVRSVTVCLSSPWQGLCLRPALSRPLSEIPSLLAPVDRRRCNTIERHPFLVSKHVASVKKYTPFVSHHHAAETQTASHAAEAAVRVALIREASIQASG
jgi:hypothetical protein